MQFADFFLCKKLYNKSKMSELKYPHHEEGDSMILVDREIKNLAKSPDFLESYDENCVTNVGYDLRAKYFVVGKEKKESACLQPGESAFVAAVDVIAVPKDMLCRVALKNSRMRQGFTIDSPVYQPGHKTRIFFRITNISNDELELLKGEKYAMLIFEQLTSEPDHPYAGAYRDEFDYSGLGQYQDIYHKQIRELEKKAENLKDMEHSIYANVLVILTIFVAIFSFLTANVSLFSNAASIKSFLLINSVLLGCISFLIAIMGGAISRSESRRSAFIRWLPSVLCFLASLLIYHFIPN